MDASLRWWIGEGELKHLWGAEKKKSAQQQRNREHFERAIGQRMQRDLIGWEDWEPVTIPTSLVHTEQPVAPLLCPVWLRWWGLFAAFISRLSLDCKSDPTQTGKRNLFLNGFPAFVLGVEPIPVSLVDDAESPIARLQPKLPLWLKQAPDGNGVRLWKNRVDRIQDPVKGLSLTRWILASGGLRRLRPILSFHLLPLSFSLSSFSLHTGGGKFQQPLFIYQLITIPPRTSIPLRIFYLKTTAKADVIWSLLCPQVLRDC